jgi:hypothetical protein
MYSDLTLLAKSLIRSLDDTTNKLATRSCNYVPAALARLPCSYRARLPELRCSPSSPTLSRDGVLKEQLG